jgi:hypothetical protein
MAAAPTRFKDVGRAACAMACGGRFISTADENGWCVFFIVVPDDLNLDDPNTLAPVPAVLSWLQLLGAKVTESRRRRK